MKTYQERQFELFEEMERGFKEGKTLSTVHGLSKDYAKDARRCLTSVVFIPHVLQKVVRDAIIEPLQQADRSHYYYPLDSLHLTIQNVRISHCPPTFTNHDIERVRQAFRDVVRKHEPFHIMLQGLFELKVSVSIRGYSDESLQKLVLDLRQALIRAGVPDDKKYASEDVFFGNVNVCRFTHQPTRPFIEAVRRLKQIEIGELDIREIALVTTSLVCHPAVTKVIDRFVLGA